MRASIASISNRRGVVVRQTSGRTCEPQIFRFHGWGSRTPEMGRSIELETFGDMGGITILCQIGRAKLKQR